MEPNLLGAYGPWAAGLRGDELPRLSFRREEFRDLESWHEEARGCLLERLAPPQIPSTPTVETVETRSLGDVTAERLRWQLPYGPPSEAVLLRPSEADGPLPGVLGLHDHGGLKYWGLRKITSLGEDHPTMVAHQQKYYGGRAWANELARRGYVILVHDAFAFASRRVRLADCPQDRTTGLREPTDDDADAIDAYNRWARDHENIMAKGLFCAGTTWPGVFFAEDRVALDILAARDDVDASRLGCGGLSGGGLRTVLLAGLDERIRAACCAGFMTTWADFLLRKSFTHTWMTYMPRVPEELDFPEVLALRVPRATMVLHCMDDPLYTNDSVREAEAILKEIYSKAGTPDRLAVNYYEGSHQFHEQMQQDAFAFLDAWLKD